MGKKKKKKSSSSNTSTTTVVATAPPTGLSIARSGGGLTFSWNIGDSDYDACQYFFWSMNGVVMWGGFIDPKQTSINAIFDPHHQKISNIGFGIQGQRAQYSTQTTTKQKKKEVTVTNIYAPALSEYATAAVAFHPPSQPTVSFTLNSPNEGTFSWEVPNVSDNNWNVFSHYEWQSVLVNKHNSYNPPGNWNNAVKGSGYSASGSWKVKEDSALFVGSNYSYTRWFRVRSVGPAGVSAWRYAYHTYALPRQAHSISASLTRKSGAGYMCTARWIAPDSFMYPCETATVEYSIAKPETSITTSGTKKVTSWSCPDGASWTKANTVSDTGGQDALTFSIGRNLGEDEVMYVRVTTKHDDHEIESGPVLATGAVGYLPKATRPTITPNPDTHKVNVAATNESDLDAPFIAIYYRKASTPNKYQVVGILPKGQSSVTCQCPNWGDEEFNIGLQTILGDYTPATPSISGVTPYKISNIKMKASEIQWDEGRVPMPPKNVELSSPDPSTIRVLWTWSWPEANQTELSWADHEDAWESTDEPSHYTVNDLFAGRWNISGLGVGTWYVRARHIKDDGDSKLIGIWSSSKEIKLSSAPAIPSLILSDGVVTPDGEVTCYWAYVSTDGTAQQQADICEATYDSSTGTYTYGDPFAKTQTAQHLTISVAQQGWQAGETHYLAVRVISASGEESQGWSTPVALKIANAISCEITESSLVHQSIPMDLYNLTVDTEIDPDKTYYTRSGEEGSYVYTEVASPVVEDIGTYYEQVIKEIEALTELPFEVTVAGAGIGSTTVLTIERAAAFHMKRPDENDIDGFEGETIYIQAFENDGRFTIDKEDLIGYLDDRAQYRLIATVKDSLGQVAETQIDFEVHWTHQAVVPYGIVEIDEDYDVAVLTPLLISGYQLTSDTVIDEDKTYYVKVIAEDEEEPRYDRVLEPVLEELATYYEAVEAAAPEGDVCDIYRLSVDKPELVYENAKFGERYVDPYPTIGSYGGYRFVYKTYNGDYTTEDNHIAWHNTPDTDNEILDARTAIINYGGDRVSLPYNLSLSNRWAKDFQQTSYLGGHIQGDWNPAVNRTGTISTVGIVNPEIGSDEDIEVIEAIRRLAVYPGICHVRTPDGSTFAANVNVSENRDQSKINQLASYSLEITKIDSQGLDGMTYDDWLDLIEDNEE